MMEPSADEVDLILPGFLRKLLDTDMPCDWPSNVAHTVWLRVWVFGSKMDFFVADVLPYTRPLPLAW